MQNRNGRSAKGGPLWHSVRYSFASEGAPFGTPSGLFGTCVRYSFASEGTPLALRPLQFCIGGGPLWHSVRPVWDLRPLQFCIGGGPLWHSVRYGFASEGTPLALRPLRFCSEGTPLALRPLQFCIG